MSEGLQKIYRPITRLALQIASLLLGGMTLCTLLAPLGFNPFGFSALIGLRTGFALGFFCLLVLVATPRFASLRPAYVLVIPALAQYNNVVLAWDAPLGANQPIRLLPILVVVLLLSLELRGQMLRTFESHRWVILAFIILGCVGFAGGIGISPIGVPGLFFFAVYFPLVVMYLSQLIRHRSHLIPNLLAGAGVAFLIFTLGSVVVIQLGSGLGLGGQTGLLSARSVSDFNVVMGFLFLLWPFVVLAFRRMHPIAMAVASVLFLAACLMGLSRVGIFIAPLLVLAAFVGLYPGRPARTLSVLGAIFGVAILFFLIAPGASNIGGDLIRRFNFTEGFALLDLLDRVRPGGEDSAARDRIRLEALRLFESDPLWGVGIGGFAERSLVGFGDAHSLLFSTLAEFGLVGAIALYGLLFTMFLRQAAAFRYPNQDWPFGRLMFVGLAGWFIAVHAAGGALIAISSASFSVNIAGGTYLLLYLFPEAFLWWEQEHPEELGAVL